MRARLRPSRLAIESPRARNNWVSWPPIDTTGTIGTPVSMAVLHVAGAAVEVDDVFRQSRPVRVVVAAGKHQDHSAGSQRLGGVLAAGLDDACAAQPVSDVVPRNTP